MDGSAVDHSDSDSGESWTLLENNPAYGEDAPGFAENPSFERDNTAAGLEKDEDTDGISIISDSDPESAPCDKFSSADPSQPQDISYNQNDPQPPDSKKTFESLCNEVDFLGDNTVKLKTYVHKRNKRLGMVLNVIMLGSIITAAGVAIGHMWGARNDCGVPTPSVNKILSNLYKLQEENAYLRKKVKELTLGNIQPMQQPKSEKENTQVKQIRCKKIFEEPLNSKKIENGFKCIDQDNNKSEKLDDPDQIPKHEKEFLNDLDNFKKIYNQNKGWLDNHIQRRLKTEQNIRSKRNILDREVKAGTEATYYKVFNPENGVGHNFDLPDLDEHDENIRIPEIDDSMRPIKVWDLGKQHTATNNFARHSRSDKDTKSNTKAYDAVNLDKPIKSTNVNEQVEFPDVSHEVISSTNKAFDINEKKISYADSLKTESDIKKKSNKNDSNEPPIKGKKGYGQKRKLGDDDLLNLKSLSEEEIKKDDRYTGSKIKKDKKKHDRHKIHKKQKRKNKYEQWEMKGGYMKDFDEFSMTSSQVNLAKDITPEKKYVSHDFEHYVDKLTETDEMKKRKKSEDAIKPEKQGDKGKKGDSEWYNKRYALRAEARKKLERELFGETSLNNAAWYFRRMNKREQCRAQKDNSTFRKFTKQKMNYKMKH